MTLTLVGDPRQELFGFRGAASEFFMVGVDRFFAMTPMSMPINYRSTQHIITASNSLIRYNYGEGGLPAELYEPALPRPDAPMGEPITFRMYETPEQEAVATAELIQEGIAMGREPQDFFVLSRTRNQLAYIEAALIRARIPYVNLCGGSFWSLRHIRQVYNYLKLAVDTSNQEAFADVCNVASAEFTTRQREYSPTRYLGREFAEACGHNPWVGMLHQTKWQWKDGIADFKRLVTDIQRHLNAPSVSDVLGFIMDACYLRYLQAENEDDGSGENALLGKLEDIATMRAMAESFKTPAEFIEYVDKAISAANSNRQTETSVVISTAHRVKGQERLVVIGIGWTEGENAQGQPIGILPHTFSLTMPPQMTILPLGGANRIYDERCIAYVIMTRAIAEVYLSGARLWRKAIMHPSRFVIEAGIEVFDD